MRPSCRSLLYLSPLALAAGALYLLARADPAGLDPEALSESWLLATLDQSVEEGVWRADQRMEAKRPVIFALLDGRLTLRQAAARFREIDADRPAKARGWRSPERTEEEGACLQVISYVDSEFAIRRRAPALAKAWVSRLEAELWGQRRPKGTPACTRTASRRENPTAEPSPPGQRLGGLASSPRLVCAPRRGAWSLSGRGGRRGANRPRPLRSRTRAFVEGGDLP
jgi:hypothetical protein